MALGIATNLEYPLADTNSRLGFEFYRVPITTGGINIDASSSPTTYTVIYSATLPTDIAGKINEIGIYSGNMRRCFVGPRLSRANINALTHACVYVLTWCPF